MYFYILLISFIFSCSNGPSYLWQMVSMHTSDFNLDVLVGSGSRHGDVPTGPCGASPEHRAAASHIDELMWVLTENLMH
jgi:hypothetical protein